MYTETELINLSALEQARLIREDELSSLDLIEMYLARIHEHNPTLQAFVSVQARRGREAARRADLLRARVAPE